MRKIRSRKLRMLATVLFAGVIATASQAFMATNTVGATNAGQGAQTISGYTASAVTYGLDTSSGTANVTSVTFTLTPDAGGSAASNVKARLSSGGSYQTCSAGAASSYTCNFSGVTALSAANLDIAAAQ